MLRGMGRVFKNASITAAFVIAAIVLLYLCIMGAIRRSRSSPPKSHFVSTGNCTEPIKKIGFAVTHGKGSRFVKEKNPHFLLKWQNCIS